MGWLLHLLVSAGLLLFVAHAIDGVALHGIVASLIAALVLGAVNALVKPVAVFLTLPITVVTLGLFLLVVNAGMLKLTAFLVPGFAVTGFLPAVWGALLLSILNLVVDRIVGDAP